MLPASKKYLVASGLSAKAASWILLACFVGGMFGIQIISSFVHEHIPSHAVNCDHVHEDVVHDHTRHHTGKESHGSHGSTFPGAHVRGTEHGNASESTPLLAGDGRDSHLAIPSNGVAQGGHGEPSPPRSQGRPKLTVRRPPSISENRILSFVRGTKANCDKEGPCYGFSDPCGRDCFKHLGVKLTKKKSPISPRHGAVPRISSYAAPTQETIGEQDPPTVSSEAGVPSAITGAHARDPNDHACVSDEEDLEMQHHHHVPENAFMSLSLQTSIAIALHKLPEGFITYATNHANPSLGFSVFTALFIHNITEGFSLALPLFLALHNRTHALLWSFLLGSISQPLGAGIAVAWFEIAGRDGSVPGEVVYGCMFAITAGIFASVGLTLFLEAISLNHNRNLCIACGFIGMAMMGMANALKG